MDREKTYDALAAAFARDCGPTQFDMAQHVYSHLVSIRNAMRVLADRIDRLEKSSGPVTAERADA